MGELKAYLVGLNLPPKDNILSIEDSISELQELAYTAGITVVGQMVQSRQSKHPAFYLGQGKLDELKEIVEQEELNIVLIDDELSPSQQKIIEERLNIKVLDRTGLILDIFAMRAYTAEAKLQVELAQLEYLLPRLTRLWTHLSRQSGGIGSRGPGETQLEVDKRQIRSRMSHLKSKIKKVKLQREIQRKNRSETPAIVGAILGYTNAGKSTLLNTITGAEVLAEDKLFATLDPKSKKLQLKNKEPIVLSDTVGFIQKLPHQLVSAFQATLEEVIYADFLIHVIDISHPHFEILLKTSEKILEEILPKNICETIPRLYVFNKIDKLDNPEWLTSLLKKYQPNVCISALKNMNLDLLIDAVFELIKSLNVTITYRIPYKRMDIVNLIHKYGTIIEQNYEDNIVIKATINKIIGEKIMAQLYN